jgi:hypothetical protein
VIAIGQELIVVKQTLPHGHFLNWLKTEFGWQERSARNFIQVADRFKSARVAIWILTYLPRTCWWRLRFRNLLERMQLKELPTASGSPGLLQRRLSQRQLIPSYSRTSSRIVKNIA